MADVDLRKLRYFVAVAEQLHFGRAAADLHIAQPVLSRQIRALEDELGVQLFVRDRRTTELTPAGRQLLADAGPLLASADALRRRVTRAARVRRQLHSPARRPERPADSGPAGRTASRGVPCRPPAGR
jgi:DNA-binding transcriptional LysR family regulator